MTPQEIAEVDGASREWRQGDIFIDVAFPAIHLADLEKPGTEASRMLAAETIGAGEPLGLTVVSTDFAGFMIVSQTCDIVRTCTARPYIEVCPLIEVPGANLGLVNAGRMPRYLSCSGLAGQPLAADLDHITTIEKRTLLQFADKRVAGAADDAERRKIGHALARKRSRVALPNDFVALLEGLQKRVKNQHGRPTQTGRFVTECREIRVIAEPEWGAEPVTITLIFLFDGLAEITPEDENVVEELIALVPASPRYLVSGVLRAMEQMTAAAYVDSDALDLDALSEG